MRDEYDFSDAIPNKYAHRFKPVVPLSTPTTRGEQPPAELPVDAAPVPPHPSPITLDPDLAAAFPTAQSVNDALRAYQMLQAQRITG